MSLSHQPNTGKFLVEKESYRMYRHFKIPSILILVLFSIQSLQAQDTIVDDVSGNTVDFEFPPLNVVIDSVIKRSSMINFRNNTIQSREASLASDRIYWSKNLGVQADSRYGNLNNFATSEDGFTNTAAFTTAKQFNYSFGVYMKVPIFDAINRKNQIKLAKSELEAAKNMVDFETEQIKKSVISIYQDLLLKKKILQLKAKSLGDGKVNMQMVEKEFRNGLVPISEYVRMNNMTTTMEEAYETALSDFITAKKMLEEMAGFVFDINLTN